MNKMISEEIKYNGKRFDVVQRIYENKKQYRYIRDCVETKSAVVVLAIDENDEVYFVKQYREVIDTETFELPAGLIEPGEDAEIAAKRELEEETGLVANKWEYLGEFFPSCGFTNEKIYLYYASELSKGTVKLDEDEEINAIEKVPLNECYDKLQNNELIHASQMIALSLFYFQKLK